MYIVYIKDELMQSKQDCVGTMYVDLILLIDIIYLDGPSDPKLVKLKKEILADKYLCLCLLHTILSNNTSDEDIISRQPGLS